MNRTKQLLAMLAIIGIVIIGFWHWPRHGTNHPSGDTEESVRREKQTGNPATVQTDSSEWTRRLAARNGSKDLESVTNTFKEASDCLLYHSARHEIDALLKDEHLADLSNATLETLKDLDATSSRYLEIARKTEPLCIGSNRAFVAEVHAHAMLQSALLGSPDAQACFVMVGYRAETADNNNPVAFAAAAKRYLDHAPAFMQSALERNDPYVAAKALYEYIRSPPMHPSALDDLPKADPHLTWRAARLTSLRATPEQRARLESDLAEFKKLNFLSPNDIKQADAEATTIFERDFAGQPSINPASQAPCYSSPDLAP